MLNDVKLLRALARISTAQEQLDDDTWRAVIPWEGMSFRLIVRRASGWLRIEVSPFLPAPADPQAAGELYRELLRRNRTLVEARFALADDGDVVLETIVDEAGGDAALGAGLDALVAAAQAHYSELVRRR